MQKAVSKRTKQYTIWVVVPGSQLHDTRHDLMPHHLVPAIYRYISVSCFPRKPISAMDLPHPHVALFSTKGKGHLIPFIELCRILLHRHGFSVTIILPDDGSPLLTHAHPLQTIPAVHSIFLPPVNIDDIPETAAIESRIALTVIRSIPSLINTLAELNRSARITAYVADVFGAFTLEAVKELGIPVYMFYASGAIPLSYGFRLPPPEVVKIPGRPAAEEFVDLNNVESKQIYQVILAMCSKYRIPEGILVNSFPELEPEAFQLMADAGSGEKPPVYPVGPLIRSGSGNHGANREDCLKWLDKQAQGSVLYVAFGSGGTLSSLQLKELATGLELSGQRFLFVVRKPNDVVRNGAYFSGVDCGDRSNPAEYLPPDFISRMEGKGFVQRNWAPQIEILRHAAVGGFLTHCGWNSTLESIMHGVPLIAWPLFAEQGMNATFVSEGLKVGFRVKEDEKGTITGKEIAGMVRRLMEGEEGEEMRQRMRKLKDVAEKAWGEDGSAIRAFESVTERWKVMTTMMKDDRAC